MNQQRAQDPLYAGPRQAASAQGDVRNGSGTSLRINGRTTENADNNQLRAAKFEEEKRRIIESCFSKRDADGTQLESYITHVRVIEDAAYPSTPSPPDSDAANKKNRVILVAVRQSGKVRVHKARQNPSGTFSIGKTWNLDELTAINSYVAYTPKTHQENLEKQWASNVGFVVTLGKPYYWQAPTSKEKDFFIASLIKIFRKYTGGRLPQLIGFSPQDLESLTGSASGPQTPALRAQRSPTVSSTLSSPPLMPVISSERPQSPYSVRIPSQEKIPAPIQDRSVNRSEYRPSNREGQRLPSEDSTRSPARNIVKPSIRDEPRNVSSTDRPLYYDHIQSKSQTSIENVQSQPLPKQTPSPNSSQSSLKPADKRPEPPVPKVTAFHNPPPSSFEASKKNFEPNKSSESLQKTNSRELVIGGKNVTQTTEREIPTTVPVPILRHPDGEGVPEWRKLPTVKREGSLSYHSQATSAFVTPVGTPGALKGDKPVTVKSEPTTVSAMADPTEQTDYFGAKAAVRSQENIATEGALRAEPRTMVIGTTQPDVTPLTSTPLTAEPEEVPSEKKTEEEFRPGLGPMLKKKSGKDIANQFRKAALAASAFQPRQGGAGARLKAMQDKTSDEPDGITGVVPAPLFRGMSSDSGTSSVPDVVSPGSEKDRPFTPLSASVLPPPKVQLQRTATEDSVKVQVPTSTSIEGPRSDIIPSALEKPRSGSPQRKRRQKQEAEVEKYCAVLGLDPRIMEGRGADFNDLLTEFGWDGKLGDKVKLEDFEVEVRREIGRAQASGWLGHVEQQEIKVQDLSRAFEKAIAECEELDGLLTLYSHELDTLHDDIEYIEAQSQGLQVQTANQKLLQAELQTLLKTLTISPQDLRPLSAAPLETTEGVQAVERCLALLYRAMITIDPEIRQNKARQTTANSKDKSGSGIYADSEIGQIRAVRQKKEDYREETLLFLRRFNQHMTSIFKNAEQRNSEDNSRNSESISTVSISMKAVHTSRQEMWMYNAMMLFVREVNSYEWQTLITGYELNIKGSYQDQFRDFVSSHRKNIRVPVADESEALFTHQDRDKGDESLTSTAARKLTVKRGKTVKSSALRQSLEDRRDGKADAWEVFNTILQQQTKVIAEEQNFIVQFFHLNSHATVDFADIVSSKPPSRRALPNLDNKQSYDPDRNLAKIVQQVMDGIFTFWTMDMQSLVDWVSKTEPLQEVGVLCAIENCLAAYEETNQEYITRTLRTLHERMTVLFHKFVDEQIKAIEETKVKVKKRKGIISFMKTFPVFSTAMENMVATDPEQTEALEVRFIINDAYIKILKAMWECLNFIARDNPAHGSSGAVVAAPSSGDPEDKEALNYHILLIENMNHYIDEVEARNNVVLLEWADRAVHDLNLHLGQYVDAVIRRPLGKWLDFVESTEALMKTTESYASIADKPSHSRSSAKKILSAYDVKEIRKGIDVLKKRVEKHFGDLDEPSNTSRSLITRVFDECSVRFQTSHDRMRGVIDRVYDGSLEIDWRREEVAALFKR